MLTQRNVRALWLLLLLHGPGSAMKFNMFKWKPEVQEGGLRLFGSKSPSEGRVEVYYDGRWGTVCDDGWDMTEAQVVCRQLNFPGAKSVIIGKDYGGVASGPIWLDDINCNGTESHLFNCGFKSWGVTDCTHKEDVGVICETTSNNLTMSDSTHSLDHSLVLSDFLGKMFDGGNDCDFLILVQSPTENRQEDGTPETVETMICAHKAILSQFPLFNASEGINNITVNISQACQPYFSSFIRYIYILKINVTISSVQCLHSMASKFGVKKLMEDTGRLFSEVLPEDASFHTQVSLYKYGEETGDLVLQEICAQYLAWNYQNLTSSPAWADLPVKLFGVLLARSDLVVPDEYFLLQSVENWIKEKGDSISSETQADLLNHIRFPMIPAEKLYWLESNSSLYSTHKTIYHENMLKAFEFNVLLFSNLLSNPKFNKEDKDDYRPRIYTSKPWSTAISLLRISASQNSNPNRYQYPYNRRRGHSYDFYYNYPTPNPYSQTTTMFSTPVHNSLIFKDNLISWEANYFTSQYECSNRGVSCTSLPVVRLTRLNNISQQRNILFRNRLLLQCQGRYICQVQDFKVDLAHISTNGTQVLAYPCPDDQYTFHFVVRPEYV